MIDRTSPGLPGDNAFPILFGAVLLIMLLVAYHRGYPVGPGRPAAGEPYENWRHRNGRSDNEFERSNFDWQRSHQVGETPIGGKP